MKKLVIWLILLTCILLLNACKTKSEEPEPIDPNAWKVVYDIEETSQDFLDNVHTCYQIFPYAFADSNDDGVGDLNGITENLNYLAETLNVTCVWLNPIHPSPSYHKYDVTDYYSIDQQFGTMSDFEALLSEADRLGIRILMDLVINHTSSQHPMFINSSIGPAATYRDYYVWNDLSDRTKFPDSTGWYQKNSSYYFASFWSEMPELNFDNPKVREEIKNILTFWLNKGVDGFRIDAAKHLYDTKEYPIGTGTLKENTNYFREFNHHVKTLNSDAFVLGEIYTIGSSYVSNYLEGMDSVFNFEFADTVIKALNQNNALSLADKMRVIREDYIEKRTNPIDSLFLSNHDQNRVANQLFFDMDKMKLAAHILLTFPGISWIYYGEELGMSGVKPDENIRQPFKWGDELDQYTVSGDGRIGSWDTHNTSLDGMTEQLLDQNSLLQVYIELIALRNTYDFLSKGLVEEFNSPKSTVLTYRLVFDDQTYLVIHNFGNILESITHQFISHDLLYTSNGSTINNDIIELSPYGSMIIQIPENIISFS